jgi:hypothetical protein
MLRHVIRVSVAILTFTIGIAIVWTLELIPRVETMLVDDYFAVDESDLRDVSPVLVDSTQDTNEIYRLIIRERYTFRDTRLVVLRAGTARYPLYEDDALRDEYYHSPIQTFRQLVNESMPEVESETLDSYQAVNQTSQPLLVSDLATNYVLVTDLDLHVDNINDFWPAFYRKYPGASGLICFSNVGFNRQHDQAFLYASRSCGGLCGEGTYILLKKVNGRWEIAKEQCLWIS